MTDIQGLERRSFTPGWDDTGYCKSFVVAEELPLASVFGPHGAEVLTLVERVEKLTADEVVALGELTLSRGGFASDLSRRVGWAVTNATGLKNASFEARWRIEHGILTTALATEDPSLVDEFQGCDRYLAIVHPTWGAAQVAAEHAMLGVLLADAIDRETYNEMTSTWLAFIGGDDRVVGPHALPGSRAGLERGQFPTRDYPDFGTSDFEKWVEEIMARPPSLLERLIDLIVRAPSGPATSGRSDTTPEPARSEARERVLPEAQRSFDFVENPDSDTVDLNGGLPGHDVQVLPAEWQMRSPVDDTVA